MQDRVKKKVLLLGDAGVGKTSLIRRFVVDKFSDDYIATIGTKVTKKELRVAYRGEEVPLILMIWDVLGQKEYRAIHETSFQGATGALMVADLTRRETVQSLEEHWIPLLWGQAGKVPLAFAGNKTDLLEAPWDWRAPLEDLASKYDAEGWMTSAKTGDNVEAAFVALGGAVLSAKRIEAVEARLASPDGPPSLAEVADGIMADFCREFGGMETGMPVVKQQFTEAGVHVEDPTEDQLRRAVDLLAEVEGNFRGPEAVRQNRERRLGMIRKAVS